MKEKKGNKNERKMNWKRNTEQKIWYDLEKALHFDLPPEKWTRHPWAHFRWFARWSESDGGKCQMGNTIRRLRLMCGVEPSDTQQDISFHGLRCRFSENYAVRTAGDPRESYPLGNWIELLNLRSELRGAGAAVPGSFLGTIVAGRRPLRC